METFDTNVVLRLVYRDDIAQAERAQSAWEAAIASGGIFLSPTVLVEVAWVLRRAAKFDRSSVAAALAGLIDSDGVRVDEDCVRRALTRYEQGSADFSDCLILERAHDEDALPVVTFDNAFAKESNVRLV